MNFQIPIPLQQEHEALHEQLRAATQAGVALGPGLMGLLHDVLGSYRPALWCLVALELVAAVSVLGGRPRHRDP